MKNLFICLFALSLCACAGNPPTWWNPSGTYSPKTNSHQEAEVQSKPVVMGPTVQEEPMEQSIEPALESYEEMRLTPLPQTDGTEQNQETQIDKEMTEAEELNLTGTQSTVSTATSQPKEDSLLTDGPLPPPSVLE
ncbi:MAG: hypothetical protein IKL48_06980 [Elusimicrobiaceae bacterium]|nr:hypothetical protein [Elusimicrobiaceae bacterium]